MDRSDIKIQSPNINYTEETIEAKYTYQTTSVRQTDGTIIVTPVDRKFTLKTSRRVPKLGVMLVGWGGNNGTTFTAACLANKLNLIWNTKSGPNTPNWLGSITQSSTVNLGLNEHNKPVYVPMSSLLPMVSPDNLEIDGWDISSTNMAEAMKRAQVLDYDLQQKLFPHMSNLSPRRSIYNPDFIAANQKDRADNVLEGGMWDQLMVIQANIRDFKEKKGLERVVVLWTANTERNTEIVTGVNDTADGVMAAIMKESPLIAPSTIFAVAAILEGVSTSQKTARPVD